MKFTSLLSLGTALAFVGFASAVPAPQDATTTTHYCGGENNLQCPTGWRCCGPITQFGGICYQGTTGLCPL
ncbi:hypothetical protein BDQ17DRAFT_1379567 [Cyathus striatus]|nr:hypothetical protein BDQ17DRAFT_1379567 [Cyathus striatus]